ncbi:MAG: putative transporter [Phycisphaerales bacterium]|nr:putative transporter [Phycisphaerales bacterium]
MEGALDHPTVAGTIVALCAVIAAGLALGALRVRGVGLGVTGVLFAGLLAGHLGVPIAPDVLQFLKDAGLILFVFAIGLQIGPGFAASLRRSGLRLNLAAAGGVVLGTGLAGAIGLWLGFTPGVIVGVLAGGTTNTPSLAAAQSVLGDHAAETGVNLAPASYAMAYPMGVIGTILCMLIARAGMGKASLATSAGPALERERPARLNIEITNPNLDGVELRRLRVLTEQNLVVTRRLSGGEITVPSATTRLRVGDVILIVGPASRLDEIRLLLGRESAVDLQAMPSAVISKRMVVTRRGVLGKSLRELDLTNRLGVTVSRISRAGVEFAPSPELRLNFADSILAVGPEASIKELASEVGDSARTLEHSHLIPVFVGIGLGVLVGSIPIALPGLPTSVRLGLAGGPLLVAIALSRIGRIGPMVCYLPLSANFALREIGIAVFLACVGVSSGPAFAESLVSLQGLTWFGAGCVVTLVPLLVVAAVARVFLKLDQPAMFGLLAGSMTDPPALAFANSLTQSEAPGMAYSTVYPLTMLLRVVCMQVLAILVM